MNNNDPWSVLSLPSNEKLNRRKARDGQIVDIYWVLDDSANKGLLIDVDDLVKPDKLMTASFKLKGMKFGLIKESKKRLLITLHEHEFKDIFLKLCNDLIDIACDCASVKQVFPAVAKRISAWKKLLANSRGNLLSDIEKQGLYAELLFFKTLIESKPELETEFIGSWKGPEKSQHDFVIGDKAIEIKSITNSSRNKVKISSEDQLCTKLNELYLSVYFLVVHGQGEIGRNLNELVKLILLEINDSENKEKFESKLLEARYIDISDNDLPRFSLKEITNYKVYGDFPRIIPEFLIDGVNSVKYKIELSSIDDYKVDEEII